MRSHTVKLNTARQAQRVTKTVRILRVFVVWERVRLGPCRSLFFNNSSQYRQCTVMRVYACVCVCMTSFFERADATNSDNQRTILDDAAHGPPSRTCTDAPSWPDSVRRCIKLQEKALRAHLELSVFLRRVLTRGLRGENENPHGLLTNLHSLRSDWYSLKQLPGAIAMAFKSGDRVGSSAWRDGDTAT